MEVALIDTAKREIDLAAYVLTYWPVIQALTRAANFSASGLKRQDNDLVVIESAEAAAAFKRNFEA